MEYKYYILSKLHRHVSGVISETETHVTIQALTVKEQSDPFSQYPEKVLVADTTYQPRTESKDHLSRVFGDVELTKSHKTALEHLTGKNRAAVKQL